MTKTVAMTIRGLLIMMMIIDIKMMTTVRIIVSLIWFCEHRVILSNDILSSDNPCKL